MNAKLRVDVDGNPTYACPTCDGDLQYWTSYDVLLCPVCEDHVYDPDTGVEQGPLE